MGLARAWSVAVTGVTGRLVGIEADVGPGLPGFGLIGLPDTALSEARERVRAAVQNSGEAWPKQKVTVSMSPADLHKRGGGFDLVLALVVLAAAGAIPAGACTQLAVLGELGLDGTVRGLRGVLPAVTAVARSGLARVLVPAANLTEAALVEGLEVVGVGSLRQALALLRGEPVPEESVVAAPLLMPRAAERTPADLADVRGQVEARRALEVAAAGGHHLFLHGAPGAGKTMLAERLPGLLPELDRAAALEVTEIHSVAGLLPAGAPLVTRAPYARPHHTATTAALVGGGSGELLRPGAASLAHRGVLFLDEAPEYRAGVLDSLRQPMESGEVLLARSGVTARFPAAFQLVLAANPCPCGKAVDIGRRGGGCSCSPVARRRYQSRISRPLLDRIDLQVFVDLPTRSELTGVCDGESTAVVADRVREARQRTAHRLAGTGWMLNSQVPSRSLRRELRVDAAALRTVEGALDNGLLSARGMDRVLRVAWSLADLAGRARPGAQEVGAALALRSGVVNGWAA
jgi:magnesium chelatase family protein